MAIGRISGPLLKANLLRNGVDLAFETNLLYLDVKNGRIGIKTATPSHDLQVVGTTRTTNLEATNQADLATFTFLENTISSTSSTINLAPSGSHPVVYQGTIVTGNLQLSTNLIETTGTNTDLQITTTGTGKVLIGTPSHNTDVLITGNLHATGSITADGNITIGDTNTDNITFNADISSDIVPDQNNLYDLGSDPGNLANSNPLATGQAWKTTYSRNIQATNIFADQLIVNDIDLRLPQGNIYYVATNGNDDNAGVHENDPLATVRHALSLASAGDIVFIYPGIYTEIFPLTVPVGVTVHGSGLRAVTIKPTTSTRYNDAFLLNGETTVEDLAITDFFSGGNYFSVISSSAGTATFNVGTAPFAHTWQSGGTITFNSTSYSISSATYNYVSGELTVTYTGPAASGSVFISNLLFECNGSTRIFPDNGYAFRFAENFLVTTRSPYVRNCTVITKGSTVTTNDPYGFDSGDAGKGAFIDGAYANSNSKEASLLFHSVTFITPNVDCIVVKNGVRVEWLNSFTYYANRGIYALSSNYGFARQGKTRLRIDSKTGTWTPGNTVTYYDTDGVTALGSGVISSIDGNYVNLAGKCVGFQTVTDRTGKTTYAQGTAKLSTTQKKFGTTSLYLANTTGAGSASAYVTIPTNTDFGYGTGDYTIECWIFPTSASVTDQIIIDHRTDTSTHVPVLHLTSNLYLYLTVDSSPVITTTSAVTLNSWSHIAICRQGSNTRLYLNGNQVGSTYVDSTNFVSSPLTIGTKYNFVNSFAGYIDDLRIEKGSAKYTGATYTVPSQILKSDNNTVLMLHFDGSNNANAFLDDGYTQQDVRTDAGGRAYIIDFADYSDFGAEIRSIGSANVYGNYGIYGDGDGVIAYLISQNFAYVGSGKLSTNDPNDRIAENEVTKLNRAKIYYTSVDNEGNFSVGDSFYVNQKTGEVVFNNQSLSISAPEGVVFTDGVHTTTILPTNIDTGNIRISGNTVESVTGDLNITSASGSINLQNNTYISGSLDVTGNITLGGNIQIGDQPSDIINFVGGINSDLIPSTTATYNLGNSITPLRWKNVYLNRAEIDGLVIDNNIIRTTIGNDDLELIANGTGRIYIPESDVQIDQNLTVTQNFTVETGTSYLKNVGITGTITQTGDIQQTGNFTTSGNTEVTGNIIGTGYLQLPVITISGNTVQTTTTNTDLILQANGTGNVVFEGLKVQDNNIRSTVINSDIILTPQGTGSVRINSNQSAILPVGTTLQRPATPENGMVRYNTDTSRYEARANGYWIKLGGVEDVSGNTRILPESSPGANDNTLYFYANNNLTATIDSTKLFAQRLHTNTLDIYDNTITTLVSNTDINLLTLGTGGVKIGNLRIRNNTITNTSNGAITTFSQSGSGYIKISGTNGFVIPSGDSQFERPAVKEVGMMRFNTELQLVEIWTGLVWTNVAGVSSGVTVSEATDVGIQTVLILG